MKFIIESIKKAIDNQRPSKDKQLRIRLSGFEDPRIYDEICKYVHEVFDSISVVSKLATEKYYYFKSNGGDREALHSLEANDWLAGGKSLTYYRNLSQDEAQLIILMGTESVDDQGGLSDIFFIDPQRIITELRGEYHQLFESGRNENTYIHHDLDETERVIDKLYKDLFALVPANICKLSDIADSWGHIDDVNQFLENFYTGLPEWGLCRDLEGIPAVSTILKKKKNLLQGNSDFITRKVFNRMNKRQYMGYLSKIEQYPTTENALYTSDWEGWQMQLIKSYDELAKVLREFVSGENAETNRYQLKYVDFAIVDSILNLKIKLDNPPPPKPKIVTVHGAPLSALTHAIYAIAGAPSEEEYDSIHININFAEISGITNKTDEDKKKLINIWKKVCWGAGGVFDYIRSQGIEIDDREIEIKVDLENIFSPNCALVNVENENILAASASKKLNKVSFEMSRWLGETPIDSKTVTKCDWTFAPTEGWLHTFDDLCYNFDNWCEKGVTAMLPLFQIENYLPLISAKSEEEFLDILSDSTLICSHNLLDFIAKKALNDSTVQKWYVEFSKLGTAFVDFCRSISENGFYGDLAHGGDSKVNAFIDQYVKLGKEITSSKFSSSSIEWVFNCYVHAFAIEENANSVYKDEMQDSCIIPPCHPAILQKLADQAVFLYDGCREVMLNKTANTPLTKICEAIDGLEEMSEIHEGIDIFPGKSSQYFGTTRSFSNFSICGNEKADPVTIIDSVRKKDDVYDDEFSSLSFRKIDEASRMYLDVIESYLKAMPTARFNMGIAFVNPGDLQPVVSAVYNHIQAQKQYLDEHFDEYADSQRIAVKLHILVTPENRGGKNYLTYWVNRFFGEDENVDVKVYLNEWDNTDTLFHMLNDQTDILFLQDVLKLDNLDFIKDKTPPGMQMNECRFPIVFKPIPVMKDSIKRRIELTQKQFSASTIHSQVVAYSKHFDTFGFNQSAVTKVLLIDRERRDLILKLHEYSNWVVCIDSGMDGALLRDDYTSKNYAVIGFSTGKGRQGQYNLTITARSSIIDAVNAKLKARLKAAFMWDNKKIEKAANHCMEEASRLDGVSLLSAINPHDFKINEFLAYVLTSGEVRKLSVDTGVRVIIHLDSYPHWFNHEKTSDDDTNSRPDFLLITAKVTDEDKFILDATVIECKLAQYATSNTHKCKARSQVLHGIDRLSTLFDPHSTSIRRRYWYAQLYRALSFAQITFSSDDENFSKYADSMRAILEGNFEINWSGCVMGYWKDLNGNTETINPDLEDLRIEYHDVPQQIIQKLLLGDEDETVVFADVAEDVLPENDDYIIDDIDDKAEDEFMGSDDPTDTVPKEQQARTGSRPQDNNDESIIKGVTVSTPPEEPKTLPSDNVYKSDVKPPEKPTQVEEPPKILTKKELKDVRVYIGKDRSSNKVYWEFGHPKLANRHLLITGTSGQGKTYSIQTMLKELSENGVPAVIFDYTEGFRIDQLDKAFTSALGDKLDQKIIYATGVPINPFVRHEIEIAGTKMKEKPSDVAQRIANIFAHVYNFGEQQFSAIYEACKSGLQQYGDSMTMTHFKKQLEEIKNPAAKTVLSKMSPFLDSAEFVPDDDFDWGKVIHSEGTVTVIQLTNFVREIQVIITELMLWDAWHYNKKYGNKDTPFVVVLDEAQNLSHKDSSPSAMILTEGRKFGWSAWFATQSLKVLDSDEIIRLQQAAFKLYFKPTDEEIPTIAKAIDASNSTPWINTLKGLHKGQAIVGGDRLRPDGTFGSVKPAVTGIASFEERKNETD